MVDVKAAICTGVLDDTTREQEKEEEREEVELRLNP